MSRWWGLFARGTHNRLMSSRVLRGGGSSFGPEGGERFFAIARARLLEWVMSTDLHGTYGHRQFMGDSGIARVLGDIAEDCLLARSDPVILCETGKYAAVSFREDRGHEYHKDKQERRFAARTGSQR